MPDAQPSPEACDGEDNNCNGVIDDGPAEVANGVDDDCDGLVDEVSWPPCESNGVSLAAVTDPRDGRQYPVMKIGSACPCARPGGSYAAAITAPLVRTISASPAISRIPSSTEITGR